MKLSFLSAAREVTGSYFLVGAADPRFLIDFGMVHGEANAAQAFAERLRAEFGWDVSVPEPSQRARCHFEATADMRLKKRDSAPWGAAREHRHRTPAEPALQLGVHP